MLYIALVRKSRDTVPRECFKAWTRDLMMMEGLVENRPFLFNWHVGCFEYELAVISDFSQQREINQLTGHVSSYEQV